jgi:hypothetical protein
MRLQDCLENLSPTERAELRARRGITVDPNKRIDEIEQTARALVAETDLRKSRFPAEVRALLHRLANANGVLADGANDPGAAPLIELGVAYRLRETSSKGTAGRSGKRMALGALVMPSAFVVQVPPADGDDPRALRVLLGRADHEIIALMLQTIVGKPLPVTGPLALQEVWEVLTRPGELASRIETLPPQEARLLDAIERAGSEVITEELLALDQTPGLYRTASGIAVPKRGAPYMLQRRAMLFPVGADRFVLPTEVSRIVGATRAAERAARRAQLLGTIAADDHAPSRARFSSDPSSVAAAALGMLRAWEVSHRDDVAVSRGTIRRVAERLGERDESVALLVALARSCGLLALTTPDAPPVASLGRVTIAELGAMLRAAFRRGGAWDETRLVPEALRAAGDSSSSVGSLLRSMLFDALEGSAKDRWVPVDLLVRIVLEDPRVAGARRIHDRSRRERPGLYRDALEDAVRVMLTESLPALGLADVAEDGTVVRYRPRDRGLSDLAAVPILSRSTLDVPPTCGIAAFLALTDVAEPEQLRGDSGAIQCNVGVAAIARARARGLSAEAVAARLEGVGASAPFSGALAELVADLGSTLEVEAIPASFAVHVPDEALRRTLLADASVRRLLLDVDAGPWLMVKPDVDPTRLQTRLQRHGVHVRLSLPQRSASEAPPAMESVRPPSIPASRRAG